MNTLQASSLDTLANDYAARWSAGLQAEETVQPAKRAELRGVMEANEVFFFHMEILHDYSRSGINE